MCRCLISQFFFLIEGSKDVTLSSKSQVVVVPDGLSVTPSGPGREKNEMEIFEQDDPFIPSILLPPLSKDPRHQSSQQKGRTGKDGSLGPTSLSL